MSTRIPSRRQTRRLASFLALVLFADATPVSSRAHAADAVAPGPNEAPILTGCTAGDLVATFRRAAGGIELESLQDVRTQSRLAGSGAPLFQLVVRHVATRDERILTAATGWRDFGMERSDGALQFRWADPLEGGPLGVTVRASAVPDADQSALRWTLRVNNESTVWTVRRVVFPLLDLADPGEEGVILFPRGPGELQRGVWQRDFHYRGNYPDGWCSMQFLAAYREGPSPSGLYVGLHDPWGSTKHLEFKSTPAARTVRLAVEVPAPDLTRPGNDFVTSGEVVWQLLRGDWFDAARIYRAWAEREARWWPALDPREGRRDTPRWMRELSAWVMTGGAPEVCQPAVTAFREALGLPVGFHWYNWHQIPFDNDYPHYFPTKPGFAATVAELQAAEVFVMPYINGRLWDTKDRGAEDFEFTRVARPAATKQENGEPFVERYGSQETNGAPVSLAVMCPTTPLWQERVRTIVRRLQQEEGTRGVYIDQIAAAAPTLCTDATHGHPLGGGHWWTEGYWALLDAIRREMPSDRMLTTECNGEPFLRWFDGYLTWHWQHHGQVPAFPAVYGGTIQMFGRAYRGGPTQAQALRMKAGQQLVFGEQIGWFDPAQAGAAPNREFVHQLIHARWNHRRYFYAGEMARPPRLVGDIPNVTADWQWSGEWPVTTPAVLAGAWRLPAEDRALLLFVNVSEAPVRFAFPFDPAVYGLRREGLQRAVTLAGQPATEPAPFVPADSEEIVLPASGVLTWEVSARPQSAGGGDAGATAAAETASAPATSTRLPAGVLPSLGCWFWSEAEFQPEGYRPFLDLVGQHAAFNRLTTSLRVPQREVTEPAVQDQIGRAAAYAQRYGMKLVMDLDVRLARRAFQEAHPGELQEMLRLRETALDKPEDALLTIAADVPGDHYTFATTPYVPVASRLVRVYRCRVNEGQTDPDSVEDITADCRVIVAATNELRVLIPGTFAGPDRQAVVAAAFAHLTPDVFAPHLIEFQRRILGQYADLPLAGACKDEWGFPPCFDGCPAKNDFWFSGPHAAAYAERTGGRDLVRDALLMWRGERGRERERQAAINHYQQLAWQRNAALEDDFHRAVKEIFGPTALSATHATWWPNPDLREFKKNGLHWWAATRDLAQTDEVTPFAVRTALAKKWGGPLWVNMFYASTVPEYERALWSHALGGGRINFHPVYPAANALGLENIAALLRGGLMRGDARLRLLHFIARAPLDCPVAVVFGHAAAMNWAGPHYNDVGLGLASALWRQGYPADLIPADEIQSGALRVDEAGWVSYGPQRYAAAVLYHPEFEPADTLAFVDQAARGRTALWRVGERTRDFEAQPVATRWPSEIRSAAEAASCAEQIVRHLQGAGVAPQTPATESIGWDVATAAPPRAGTGRLVDGTRFWVSGRDDAAGDPLAIREEVSGHTIEADAVGLLAVRLNESGRLEALAAGGLSRFQGGGIALMLDSPIDLALWTDEQGRRRGVVQGAPAGVPPALLELTPHWLDLRLPASLPSP